MLRAVPEGRPMTEPEWLAGDDPTAMLEFLRGKASDRKLRLSACACVRRDWYLLEDDRSRESVDEAEPLSRPTDIAPAPSPAPSRVWAPMGRPTFPLAR